MVSCRECLSYLASAETVRDHLLPAETTVHEIWLPAEIVRDLLPPAETTVHEKWLSAEIVRHIWLPPRLFVIICFLPILPSTKYGFLQRLCDSAFCRDSRQDADSHGQSLQETVSQAQQSRQEVRDRGQSRRKPNMTDSFCRKRKSADSFIPCVIAYHNNNIEIGRGDVRII